MARREFHFQEGRSDKFWTIDVEGKSFTVEFGRMGTAGQTQTKKFKSAAEAEQACAKLIAEKLKKGYQELGSGKSAPPSAVTPASADLLMAHTEAVTAVAFSPDGKTLATASLDGTVCLYDLATAMVKAVFRKHAQQVHSL